MSIWDSLVGQERAAGVLRAAAERPEAMTHAWLITGPPGSGRSVAARAFAAALQAGPDGDADPEAAELALAGAHPDVTVLATEKVVITIAEARNLVSLAQRAPSQGRWRVIIVEDADRMGEQTGNVLLKAIEEPPPRTVWVLCAPSPQDVLTTIRSRCRLVNLRIPPPQAVADLLVRRDGIDPQVALECAHEAQSHVGVARRLATHPPARAFRHSVLELATSIRGVGDAVLAAGRLVEAATDQSKEATAQRDEQEKAELLRSMGADSGGTLPPAVRAQVRQLEEEQKRRARRSLLDALDRALVDLLSFYRDVLAVQFGSDVALINAGAAESVRRVAADTGAATTLHRMDAVGKARERLGANAAPLLTIEAMAVALRPQTEPAAR